MASRDPIGFLSYVNSDDAHDDGKITHLRQRLEGELRIQTGHAFPIFQDRNDIAWGQHWAERIDKALLGVTFLIPIVTPSYFVSRFCREEFSTFLLKEKQLGLNRLILPIHYVTSDQLGADYLEGSDELADVIRARNYTDWREFRLAPLSDIGLRKAIAALATQIKDAIRELASELDGDRIKADQVDAAPVSAARNGKALLFSQEVPEAKPYLDKNIKPPFQSYFAYTKEHDEETLANKLVEPSRLFKASKKVTEVSKLLKNTVAKEIAGFEKTAASIRQEVRPSVTLLLDNSGSIPLSGASPIQLGAWASIFADTLDRANIPIEVLGYTTRTWKGGLSRNDWKKAGCPESPGRLNDLRHIIYKGFDQPFYEAANNFGLSAINEIMKENIDGEALLWAYQRLAGRGGSQILILISDGTPVDDSTLQANGETYLQDHFVNVASHIARQRNVKLYGVGIRYDLSPVITNSRQVENEVGVGFAVLDFLGQSLGAPIKWEVPEISKI